MTEDLPATPRRQHGHSRAYILDRLRRENRTDLAAAVERGEVSAFSVAVSLGWTKRPPTLAALTHQARKRRHRFQAIDGSLTSSQAFELWLGPNPTQGSLFNSREELEQAWMEHRDELMARWGSHGRRPMGWWEFDTQLEYPGYGCERSFLWRAGQLSEAEKVALEAEWEVAFAEARGMDARARREHFEHHDVPPELIEAWTTARKRRRRQAAASQEEAAAIK
jgi:hypothetical protein